MALALRKEEGLGLGIAIAAHAALVAVLLLRPETTPVVQPPERIEVTISEEVGLTSTAPQPNTPAASSIAPTLGEPQPDSASAEPESEPAPPEPEPAPPEPAPPPPRPTPRKAEPASKPTPRATRRPTPPAPKPKAEQPAPKQPVPKAPPKKAPAPKAAPAQKAPAQKAPAQKAATKAPAAKAPAANTPAKSDAPAGGSRIGDDFLKGVTGGSSDNRASTSPSAATIGPAVRSSLASAISRQLKPKWQAPQGPNAEDLVTILSFNLNRDGSLAGTPSVVRQLGISDINSNQADRHAEQAIRAVRLAAPFDLPEEYYDAWKRVAQFRFDKRLSQ